MAQMKITTFEELKDRHIGKIGTPERDAYEAEVREAIQTYHIGEAIRAARKERNMTQDQLAELMGVKKAQVSRIENGNNLTIGTIVRAFKAMGVSTAFSFGGVSMPLC